MPCFSRCKVSRYWIPSLLWNESFYCVDSFSQQKNKMSKKGGALMDTLSAVKTTLANQAQVEAFKQLEDPGNQAKAVDLIVAAPIGTDEKMKILGALDSISAQAKMKLQTPVAPVQSIPAAGGTRRRRHRRRTHKKFSK